MALTLLMGCGGEVVPEDADAGGMDAAVGRDAATEDAGGEDDARVEDAEVPIDASEEVDAGPECVADEDCTAADRCETARCESGACVIEPVVCDDGDPCTADACDPATGDCVAPRAPDGTSCPAGSCCGGSCVDDDTDDAHCGGCGNVCGGNASCDGGACACDAGFADCDSDVGCEANVGTDPANCGTCGATCTAPTPSCIGGSCAACATAADCADDGLACTGAPTCDAGVCNYPVAADRCLIGGACYTAGDGDPTDQCRECDPTQSTTAFSVRVGRSCDDGLFCTDPDLCDASGACAGTARPCDDGLSCTVDACSEAMGRCTATPTSGRCGIDGACWVSGEVNPSNPMCEACDPFGDQRAWTPLTGVGCDDGQYCTVGDACDGSGACLGTARSCSDALGCTSDTCNETTDACEFPIASGCLIAGACYATGTPNPLNQCEVCDPTTATMAWTANTGASCDDGQYCTTGDACTSGASCVGTARDCDDALSCTNDTCNETGDTCEHAPQMDFCVIGGSCVANGTRNPSNDCEACIPGTTTGAWSARTGQSCNDSMYCTEPDTCDASGVCGGAARSCDDGLSCTADSCSEGGDRCDHTLVAGTCRIGGTCYATGDLNPANGCESCDPSTSTSAWTARAGASCDDGQYCTTSDACNASGSCVGSSRDCDDGLSCTSDSCDEAADVCRNNLQSDRCAIGATCYANGTLNPANGCQVCDATASQTAWSPRTGASCDDGQYCTVGDACDSTGTCAAAPRTCSDSNDCTLDSCDEAADACENTLTAMSCIIDSACVADGAVNPANQCQECDPSTNPTGWTARTGQSCDDGQFCTVMDTCNASASCNGASRDCGDGLSCTMDTCNEGTDACQSALDAGSCVIDGACWMSGTQNPANPCEACNPAVSTTTWSPRTGASCDDGQFCTVADTCDATGACVGSANPCDDGKTCTSGLCDETANTCSQSIHASSCLIGMTCYASGATNGSNVCQACNPSLSQTTWTAQTGASCEDGLYCTTSDTCDASGACGGGPARACDDGLSCTANNCDESANTCLNPISSGRCLIAGTCYSTGSINPSNGCEECASGDRTDWTPRTGTSCDDGLYCTVMDACTSMATCAGTSRSCDDSLACTSDGCDESADACTHDIAPGWCAIGPACYSNGTPNPANPGCEECEASASQVDWTVQTGSSCDDGSYCTVGDSCDASGSCISGTPRDCSDGIGCTDDSCNPSTSSCVNTLAMGCLIAGSCWPDGMQNPSNPCQHCDPAASETSWSANVGASCDDGQYCTVSDACTASATCAGVSRSCSTCAGGSCNEAADRCDYPGCLIGGACYADGAPNPANGCERCDESVSSTAWSDDDGASCDDGLFCTVMDECSGGTCDGDPRSCGDGFGCTTDTCDEGADACVSAVDPGSCLIGMACYSSGVQNPTNECESCQPGVSTSSWTPRTGASCDDGMWCTDPDVCSSSGVCAAPSRNCSDGVSCTVDTCNESADSCQNTIPSNRCVIGGTCYADGTPHPSNECLFCNASANPTGWTSLSDGTNCDDGTTTGCGQCSGGTCMTARTCDDGNPCTNDGCNDAANTCTTTNRPNNVSCGCAQICCGGSCLSASAQTRCGACGMSCGGGSFLECLGSGCNRGGYSCGVP